MTATREDAGWLQHTPGATAPLRTQGRDQDGAEMVMQRAAAIQHTRATTQMASWGNAAVLDPP